MGGGERVGELASGKGGDGDGSVGGGEGGSMGGGGDAQQMPYPCWQPSPHQADSLPQ